MKSFLQFTLTCLLLWSSSVVKGQEVFNSLDALLEYTNQRSTTLKSGEIKFSQAQRTKLAAVAEIVDLSGGVSLNVTNNTQLPVSLFPAEAFGGAPGTYQEVQTGIQYTNNFTQNTEFKLVNISGWKNLRLAKINIDETNTENTLSRKNLYENIATTYYNIIALQEQLLATQVNIGTVDTLYQIVKNKYAQGVARQQELNDAQVSLINTQESAKQIDYLIQQQFLALKILCDIPETEAIEIKHPIAYDNRPIKPLIKPNLLSLINSQIQEQSALVSYQQQKASFLPYLSAFASNTYQQFGDQFSLFDNRVKWINSNSIGLKIVWQIPSANSISQLSKKKYDYLLAKQNTAHALVKSPLNQKQLEVDFEKAASQTNSYQLIDQLRIDSYRKNLETYQEGILPLDQLLNSYNTMVSSHYNYISSVVNELLACSKIKINNEIR